MRTTDIVQAAREAVAEAEESTESGIMEDVFEARDSLIGSVNSLIEEIERLTGEKFPPAAIDVEVEPEPECCVTGIHEIEANDLQPGDVLLAVQAWDYSMHEWYMRPIDHEPVIEKPPWRYVSSGRMAGDGEEMVSLKTIGTRDRWHWKRTTRVRVRRIPTSDTP